MKLPGLTTEQTIDAAHVVGILGSALVIFVAVGSAVIALWHDWGRAAGTPPMETWTPPAILVELCIGLITSATINEFMNLTKPAMSGTTSTTSSTQTSSSSVTPPAGGTTHD